MKNVLLLILFALSVSGAEATIPIVNLSLSAPNTPNRLVATLNIIIVLAILAPAPSTIFIMTSFLGLIIVFSLLRQAMGTQNMPPNTILVTMTLVLTFFIMEPAVTKSYNEGVKPYLSEQIGYEEAFVRGVKPFKNFVLKNTRERDLTLFYRTRSLSNPKTIDDVPLSVLVPVFMTSEPKIAFGIGFLVYLPFLVIDMAVSSVLMAMDMMMLPPVMISLPFKLLISVLVDGWNLLVQRLVESLIT